MEPPLAIVGNLSFLKVPAMHNALFVIAPYWFEGTWVFDDQNVGLVREPFVSGVPDMIDYIVRDIPDARDGFRLTFSPRPFPGQSHEIIRVREEHGGNWYRIEDVPEEGSSMEGWLCPALFHYFDDAPDRLYVKAEPKG
jgi:hypothetical protein